MLSELPSEIIYHIVSYLPAVNSVINLAQTCRHLYNVISADNYRILQAFVQSQFASIEAPPFWADAARALTSRSRAFDRRAIIARFVLPPDNVTRIGHTKTVRTDHPTLGYRPVIDSYESWYGNSWASRKEVLVWGAGADLVLRIKDFGRKHLRSTDHNTVPHNVLRRRTSGTPQDGVAWAIFNDLQGVDSWDDISSVHLLRSSESSWSDKEEVIFGRRNGSLVRMSISSEKASSKVEKRYLTGGRNLEGTDISCGSRKVLAASMDSNSIVLFRVDAEENDVPPFATLKTTAHGSARHRCSRILNDETIALGSNGEANKISIFRFSYSDVEGTNELRIDDDGEPRKAKVTVIEPLPVSHITGGNPGDVFLSGWEDSKTRHVSHVLNREIRVVP